MRIIYSAPKQCCCCLSFFLLFAETKRFRFCLDSTCIVLHYLNGIPNCLLNWKCIQQRLTFRWIYYRVVYVVSRIGQKKKRETRSCETLHYTPLKCNPEERERGKNNTAVLRRGRQVEIRKNVLTIKSKDFFFFYYILKMFDVFSLFGLLLFFFFYIDKQLYEYAMYT